MTAFEGLLTDEEVAAVLTYVRNAFGNEASAITPETVRTVREAIRDKEGFYTADELLQEHPFEDSE
jgi:mono/diheme cytochrome c family protein